MIVTLQQIEKSFGGYTVLHGISAAIDRQDRVGLIGENGAGKTTLLRLILGELEPDSGTVTRSRDLTVGYLRQNAAPDIGKTIYTEMEDAYAPALDAMKQLAEIEKRMASDPADAELLDRQAQLTAVIDAQDAYNRDVQIRKVLSGMAFGPETYEKPVGVLSGGERTRLQLAKLLVQSPDLLILDEPTNHLDFESMEWLESFLSSYRGALLAVSHDRTFLDAVATRIWALENCTLTACRGNYSAWLPQKEAADELARKQHAADLEKAKKLQDYVDRNLVRASTTKMAQSRRRQLEKMEITAAPVQSDEDFRLRFEFDQDPYEKVLTAKDLCVDAGGKRLLTGLDLEILRGDKLVIAGPNGCGKSTLMKVLSGSLRPSGGRLRLGVGVKFSVFEQQQQRVGGRVIDAIWNRYPRMTELEVRSYLARLNFRGEDVFREIRALSGGELSRLRLAEILLERPNLLFMDEPTNHLDIYSRGTLGEALTAYTGTLLLVTHDRYLMNSVGCPILYIENGRAAFYAGYRELLQHTEAKEPLHTSAHRAPAVSSVQSPKEERRKKAQARARARQLESEIESLDGDILEMEGALEDRTVTTDREKLVKLCDDLDDARFRRDELYAEWEKLIEENSDLLD